MPGSSVNVPTHDGEPPNWAPGWRMPQPSARLAIKWPRRFSGRWSRFTAAATSGQFATMAVATFSQDGERGTHATAGHPPTLIRRACTGTVDRLPTASDPPLGPFDAVSYTQFEVCLEPGDVILMYTDGLIERRGEDPEEGIRRVAEDLRSWQPGAALDGLCQQLVAALAIEPQLDDICVLAASRKLVSGA
jgi:serine phosphatase RsbU (regulator of sigma subunit)